MTYYYTPKQLAMIERDEALYGIPAPVERTACYCDTAYHPAGH